MFSSWKWLPIIFALFTVVTKSHDLIEYERYDGWFNNLANPSWGSVATPLSRVVAPMYEDGVYQPAGSTRPNPLNVSEELMSRNSQKHEKSFRNASVLMVFFGQHVTHEIVDTSRRGCPAEHFNIKIPEKHAVFGDRDLPFVRSNYDSSSGKSPNTPRQQINEATPWLDGGVIYGTSKTWTDKLRTLKDGKLAVSEMGNWPENNTIGLPMYNLAIPSEYTLKDVERIPKFGNRRGNENSFLLSIGVLWFRYHNLMAEKIKMDHPKWNDEKIFNEARKWVIATYQHIVFYEWLPSFLGNFTTESFQHKYKYKGYKNYVHPGVSHIFQSAAMRFGETMVPKQVIKMHTDKKCNYEATKYHGIRVCNNYWKAEEMLRKKNGNDSIQPIIFGMVNQMAEAEDNVIVEDLRVFTYGPLHHSRRDLVAINIQRGRDHGLPDYNSARKAFGLAPIKNFTYINNDTEVIPPQLLKKMEELYEDIDNIDIWVGGLMESGKDGPGELFRNVILDQFLRLRDGDRFWYENYENKQFKKWEVDKIKKTTFKDIIVNCTDIKSDELQQNVFFVKGAKCPINQSELTHVDETCKVLKTYDYFSGSEISFALSFLLIGLLPFIAVSVLCTLAYIRNSKREKQIAQLRKKSFKRSIRKDDHSKFSAIEWENKIKFRAVIVSLGPETFIKVLSKKNQTLRMIDTRHLKWMTVVRQFDKEQKILAIRVNREYDLVLSFTDMKEREDFFQALKYFVTEHCPTLEIQEDTLRARELFDTAVNREARQAQLEKFFKAAFARLALFEKYSGLLVLDISMERTNLLRHIKSLHRALSFGVSNKLCPKINTLYKVRETRNELLAFDLDYADDNPDTIQSHGTEMREILECELSQTEFGEALSMKPNSPFVYQMFQLADKDNNGYINFREFLDLMFIFTKGTAKDKLRLFFDMNDIDGDGTLDKEEFKKMVKSLMDVVSASVDSENLDQLVESMFGKKGGDIEFLNFDDFNAIMSDLDKQHGLLSDVSNVFEGATKKSPKKKPAGKARKRYDGNISRQRQNTLITRAREGQEPSTSDPTPPETPTGGRARRFTLARVDSKTPDSYGKTKWIAISRYIENHRKHIFLLSLYTIIMFGFFGNTAYKYAIEKEHSGLRQVTGYGVIVSRGAASAMMFTFSTLLVTMSRNTITFLRETLLMHWIPFDSAIAFHKYVAVWALLFTVIHTIGHAFNFYHLVTQSPIDLSCLLRNDFHRSHELPKFYYYCWQTLTGSTGVILCIIIVTIYVFASQFARRAVFNWFWWTHQLYIALYAFTILHGSAHLLQAPTFYIYLLGPAILFTLDKLISMARKKVEIPVTKAQLLPSDVTNLEFRRPVNFNYKSGQWVRIACLELGGSEYHPFTLTSAPHEENLSLHIRAVGPWTMNIRSTYNKDNLQDRPYPKLYLDGPFGEGHQDWYRFEVSVLVGGGIGVTPFASILKDIAHKGSLNSTFACKQVYFLWVTRTQKHFEWLTDIIREVEEKDTKKLVTVHIFVTQFYEKFDLRTTMLYICERHFQKMSGKSLFTGLQSITHFGRPDFHSTLRRISGQHPEVGKIGVFSCGPPTMTRSVEKTCVKLNLNDGPTFNHHFENF